MGALVYVHSVICETYLVAIFHTSMVFICSTYMCIYGNLFDWRSMVGRGYMCPRVYVHSAICSNLFGVVVFHRSMVELVGHGALVYVHSAICETYLV